MIRKFLDGLAFGAGFSIVFLLLWYIVGWWIAPNLLASGLDAKIDEINAQLAVPHLEEKPPPDRSTVQRPHTPFHELEVEEQIKEATVIALARYERAGDGRVKAVIKEFLKKEPNTTIYYDIGDEYVTHFPNDATREGTGLVIFFVGSPAQVTMSATFSGDRIRGLGDIPLELFKKKCDEAGA
ncbi:MAG: hypothetical protein FWF20_09910 [Betaproteobacteria bacterium]|nr:hypothetical protein [Betaproteobacteria bacterium]MCL2887075.1 hypothetical protein [Betaproteobacteria bacterium]